MKVLIVTTCYPRNARDLSGVFIKRLAIGMTRSGAQVTVLAPGDREAKIRERDNGIDIYRFFYAPRPLMRIGYGLGGIPENLRRSPWLFFILPFFLLSMTIYSIILSRDSDIIHANWLHTGFFSLLAKRIRQKPLVVTLRGSDLRREIPKFLPFVFKRANAVTSVNRKWAVDLQKKFNCKVFYTPNGVEIPENTVNPRTRFGIGLDEVIVLCVGVLQERKGIDVLAEAAKIMLELNRPLRFLMIGPGDPKKFGLDKLPNVICTGGIPPHEVLAVYPHCDIFVLPSRFEGRPNVLLEAMASGLPSVATRLPGILEVLTDESGILVDTEDARALAEAICVLANDPAMRKIMGKKAKEKIAELRLDWQSSAEKYLRIFDKIY